MNLWRITPKPSALDKACTGTRLFGGRWNPIGYPALYAATTIELCALEKLAHALDVQQPELALVLVQVPDDPSLFLKPSVSDLPADWAAVPVGTASQEFGRRWLASAKQLVLLLPSAIIPESTVAMINPAHSAYDHVDLNFVRDFSFDPRLRYHDDQHASVRGGATANLPGPSPHFTHRDRFPIRRSQVRGREH